MDTATRNALVMDNYGYWVWVVEYARRTRTHLKRVDRDELVQDAVCELLEAAGNWDGVRSFTTYGFTIIMHHLQGRYYRDRLIRLVNQVVPGGKAEGRRRELLEMNLAGEKALSLREAPPSPEAREAEGRELREAVDALPPHFAERIKDYYGLGRPAMLFREIGARDGHTREGARCNLNTAMKHLRRRVA